MRVATLLEQPLPISSWAMAQEMTAFQGGKSPFTCSRYRVDHGDMASDTETPLAARLRSVAQLLDERPAFKSDGADPQRWVRRLIYERRLPHHKVGNRVFIDIEDADRVLQRRIPHVGG